MRVAKAPNGDNVLKKIATFRFLSDIATSWRITTGRSCSRIGSISVSTVL